MSALERRAWLSLLGMCPGYLVYFTVQIAAPGWPGTLLGRFGFLAAVACTHAAVYLAGLALSKLAERGQGLLADERDRTIDARATRSAYFVLLAAAILAGMVLPFINSGWNLVNAALMGIVLAEITRNALIVMGYRGTPRLAY